MQKASRLKRDPEGCFRVDQLRQELAASMFRDARIEAIALNPASLADSVFAVIDAGFVWLEAGSFSATKRLVLIR